MRRSTAIQAALLLVVSASAIGPAEAGHESPFYPSFYPQEIRIGAVDPGSAAAELRKGTLHAYVGGDPFAQGPVPEGVKHVESLGSYLVVTFDTAAPAWRSRESRCAAAGAIVGALGPGRGAYRVHPYPITPYHADYVEQADLAEAAKARLRDHRRQPAAARPALRLAAKGELAERLVPAAWRSSGGKRDATVEEVRLADLVSPYAIALNGWLGPPWIKEGWFHAYLLYAGAMADQTARQRADAIYRRLLTGDHAGGVERLSLARTLVSLLTSGCERVVAGYTTKRESFNDDYSQGVENIAFDAHEGLGSPVFVRTVKLKDFPWNGWLRLGVASRPAAAWNPVGGFSDPAGRLIWAAVGDPALFPEPYAAGWVANRVAPAVTLAEGPTGGLPVPRDALVPEPGSGALREVGDGKTAKAKIVYRVLASPFHDGTSMTAADVLYAFAFAYRWGARRAQDGAGYDPLVERETALARDWLAGVKPVRVDRETLAFGDLKFTREVPVVEVYLRHPAADPRQAAAVAPPWSSVPWPLLALMEEAVTRGVAAFSAEDAARRGVAWLDLARDERVKAELASLVERFARTGYVPPALARLVTADEARARWAALARFHREHGHFLVTNGPYRLGKWSADSAVLEVFRDLKYPLGVGAFDRYALPRRAYISKAEVQGDRLEVSADIDTVFRFQRSYELTRKPFGSEEAADQATKDSLVCRYVVVGPGGEVLKAGVAPDPVRGRFVVELGGTPGPGPYLVTVALYLNGNAVGPDVRMIPYRPDGHS